MGRIVSNFFISLDGVVEPAPHQERLGGGQPGADDGEFGSFINAAPKYVVTSRPIEGEPWNNTTAITSDHAAALRAVKERTDGDLGMSGCATTVRWLLAEGLLDELALLVHPIAVAKGQRLFEGTGTVPLSLVHSETLPSGVLHLRYVPVSA